MAEITYHNRGVTRSQPLSSKLEAVLRSAADSAGVDTVMVMSGGQSDNHTPETKGKTWTGSHRHDDGNAGDIQIVVGGRTLNFSNPADQAVFSAFARAAAAYGATGIGAGLTYMGPNRIHVGFGSKAVWGGTGKNAPPPPGWLSTAVKSGWGSPQAVGAVTASSGGGAGGIIGKGSPKNDVSSMQAALRVVGFDPGPVDGVFGKRTEAAVRAFQQATGLSMVDGKAGPQTLGALQNAVSASTVGQVFSAPGLGGYQGQIAGQRLATPTLAAGMPARTPQARPTPAPTVFTGNMPRPRPTGPLSPVNPDYPASRIAGAFSTAQGPPTIAPANRAPTVSFGPLQGTAAGSLGRGASAAASAPRPTVNQPTPVSYTPFASRAPSSLNYTGGGPTSGPAPSAFGAGSNVAANWQDRAKIAEAIPSGITGPLARAAMDRAAADRAAETNSAWWNAPPSVGAGFTTPLGQRSPELASSKVAPPSTLDAIFNNLTGSAQAAPRTMNYAAAPPRVGGVGATSANQAITDNFGNPKGDNAYGTGRAGPNAVSKSGGGIDYIGLALSGGMPAARDMQAFGQQIGPSVSAAARNIGAIAGPFLSATNMMTAGLGPQRAPTAGPTLAIAPTPRSVLQGQAGQAITAVAPGQAAAAVPRGLGSLLMSPEARMSMRPTIGPITVTPTPVRTQSFPGLQQVNPDFAAPQVIAGRVLGQLKSAQPPAPPSVNRQAGQAGIAPSRAAGGRTFDPSVAAVQKSLRDAGVTDFQGNSLVVDGVMGSRTASAMSSPAGRAVLGGMGGASGLASQGVSRSAPSVSRSVSGGAAAGSSGGTSSGSSGSRSGSGTSSSRTGSGVSGGNFPGSTSYTPSSNR